MEEAISGVILVFYKLVDFLFYGADIRSGLSIGFIVMAASITATMISTLGPRVIGPKTDVYEMGRKAGFKDGILTAQDTNK